MQLAPAAENFAKLALYVALLILPGGSIVALILVWAGRRWGKLAGFANPFTFARRADPSRSAAWQGLGRSFFGRQCVDPISLSGSQVAISGKTHSNTICSIMHST